MRKEKRIRMRKIEIYFFLTSFRDANPTKLQWNQDSKPEPKLSLNPTTKTKTKPPKLSMSKYLILYDYLKEDTRTQN